MPTPSIFPMFTKAQAGGGGPPVQTFTSEPISLDIDTTSVVSLAIDAAAFLLAMSSPILSLDLADAVITAQTAGQLEIAAAPISLEIDACP